MPEHIKPKAGDVFEWQRLLKGQASAHPSKRR
ncbi:conserved protein of unknown function [Ectopseudomonas oleovorans]|uniref:Uncharacterized protein n=1 Tax=Ectopseudomonas oleovorans TaxID=301 RepID=A0A653B8G8_ECTOL|nr:conserved protein of unknown function [Pseudomonas oleovorans]